MSSQSYTSLCGAHLTVPRACVCLRVPAGGAGRDSCRSVPRSPDSPSHLRCPVAAAAGDPAARAVFSSRRQAPSTPPSTPPRTPRGAPSPPGVAGTCQSQSAWSVAGVRPLRLESPRRPAYTLNLLTTPPRVSWGAPSLTAVPRGCPVRLEIRGTFRGIAVSVACRTLGHLRVTPVS